MMQIVFCYDKNNLQNMPEIDSKKPAFFSRVEDITKLGLPLLGIFYVFGFIVEALYLSKFGTSPLSLVRVQYILAGIWLLVPLIILAGLVFSLAASFNIRKDELETSDVTPSRSGKFRFYLSRILLALMIFLGCVSMAVIIFALILTQLPRSYAVSVSFPDVISGVFLVAFLAMLMTMSVLSLREEWQKIKAEDKKFTLASLSKSILNMILLPIYFLGYVSFFSLGIYDKIPAVLGGGAPARVKFVLKKEAKEGDAAKLIRASEDGFSEPYLLLFSTDNSLVILDPNNSSQAMELSKDLIDGIVFNVK